MLVCEVEYDVHTRRSPAPVKGFVEPSTGEAARGPADATRADQSTA